MAQLVVQIVHGTKLYDITEYGICSQACEHFALSGIRCCALVHRGAGMMVANAIRSQFEPTRDELCQVS